ncbi:uncharacterized protein BDV14DRAFT_170859 [Aspergillus stella-maris]|uniref:uncharacterized protein n=1 Tax=Aspergillus stella-maris TaxID=1810926 RepID=UPI003CCD25D6
MRSVKSSFVFLGVGLFLFRPVIGGSVLGNFGSGSDVGSLNSVLCKYQFTWWFRVCREKSVLFLRVE